MEHLPKCNQINLLSNLFISKLPDIMSVLVMKRYCLNPLSPISYLLQILICFSSSIQLAFAGINAIDPFEFLSKHPSKLSSSSPHIDHYIVAYFSWYFLCVYIWMVLPMYNALSLPVFLIELALSFESKYILSSQSTLNQCFTYVL